MLYPASWARRGFAYGSSLSRCVCETSRGNLRFTHLGRLARLQIFVRRKAWMSHVNEDHKGVTFVSHLGGRVGRMRSLLGFKIYLRQHSRPKSGLHFSHVQSSPNCDLPREFTPAACQAMTNVSRKTQSLVPACIIACWQMGLQVIISMRVLSLRSGPTFCLECVVYEAAGLPRTHLPGTNDAHSKRPLVITPPKRCYPHAQSSSC